MPHLTRNPFLTAIKNSLFYLIHEHVTLVRCPENAPTLIRLCGFTGRSLMILLSSTVTVFKILHNEYTETIAEVVTYVFKTIITCFSASVRFSDLNGSLTVSYHNLLSLLAAFYNTILT